MDESNVLQKHRGEVYEISSDSDSEDWREQHEMGTAMEQLAAPPQPLAPPAQQPSFYSCVRLSTDKRAKHVPDGGPGAFAQCSWSSVGDMFCTFVCVSNAHAPNALAHLIPAPVD